MNVCKSSPDQVIGCIGEKGEGKFRGTTIIKLKNMVILKKFRIDDTIKKFVIIITLKRIITILK